MSWNEFRGAAARLDDIDLPRIGSTIGVGEDELHAFMDVEAAGAGFDKSGRPKMLFEPHVLYRNLSGAKRDAAVARGLAYASWGQKPYPADSYPRLVSAIAIDEAAALRASSWGLSQILAENHASAGYATPQDMVRDFMEDEAAHLEATTRLMVRMGIADDLRELVNLGRDTTPIDCVPVVRVWNGSGYAKNGYHTKFAAAHNKWRRIPDTPWTPPAGPGSVVAPRPRIGRGSRNAFVKLWQEALLAAGFDLGPAGADGVFGGLTEVATKRWQETRGLLADGVVGSKTWAALIGLTAAV